jgi:hypothetical protein
MGGYNSPSDKVNYYNGTNWSEVAVLPEPRQEGIGIGKDANALHIGGGAGSSNQTSNSAKTKKYSVDGNSWSEETDAPANIGGYGGAGTSESAIVARQHDYDSLLYNDGTWSTIAAIIDQNKSERWGMWGTQNDAGLVGASNYGDERRCTQLWNGTSWSEGSAMNFGRGLAQGKVQGSPSSAAAGLAFSTNYNSGLGAPPAYARSGHTELYNGVEFSNSTGSFGLLKPRAGGINTEAFQVTSSLFKLPVFSDVELNYQAYEAEYSTGSLSGSVDRVADAIVGQNLGEMWFDSDKNAIGYTYQSSSLISQSLSLGTFTNTSASSDSSGYYFTSSIGLFTQSFYSHTVVTCYLTGSQI